MAETRGHMSRSEEKNPVVEVFPLELGDLVVFLLDGVYLKQTLRGLSHTPRGLTSRWARSDLQVLKNKTKNGIDIRSI
jgi:hypothetical protein